MRIKLNVRERAATGVLAALLALPAMANAQAAPAAPAAAQAGATPPTAYSHGDLAKQLANPVAALVSGPFQSSLFQFLKMFWHGQISSRSMLGVSISPS